MLPVCELLPVPVLDPVEVLALPVGRVDELRFVDPVREELDEAAVPWDPVSEVEVTREDELAPVAEPVLLPEDAVRVVEAVAAFSEPVFVCVLLVLCEELDPVPALKPVLLLAVAWDEGPELDDDAGLVVESLDVGLLLPLWLAPPVLDWDDLIALGFVDSSAGASVVYRPLDDTAVGGVVTGTITVVLPLVVMI